MGENRSFVDGELLNGAAQADKLEVAVRAREVRIENELLLVGISPYDLQLQSTKQHKRRHEKNVWVRFLCRQDPKEIQNPRRSTTNKHTDVLFPILAVAFDV